MDKIKFNVQDFESQLPEMLKKKVTQIYISDKNLDKKKIIRIINLIAEKAPSLFVSFFVDASIVDKELAACATQIFCSIDIPLTCEEKGGKLLFDKKYYSSKARLLNDFGLVFGFDLFYSVQEGDSLKLFCDRLDFALQQYPNHINFLQTEEECQEYEPKITGFFSAKDVRYARDVAFACRTFYSEGRAVPWFLSVLKPLRIYPSKFFADMAEWQRCNNCDFKSGFVPEKEKHQSLEKMQLLFLEEKYEEKNRHNLIPIVKDIVKVNGAMARLAGENIESTVHTSYNPDDLFSEEALDIESFAENVCMEECNVKIFATENGPDYSTEN